MRIIPVRYTGINGVYEAPTETQFIYDALMRMYPVANVRMYVRSPTNFSGGLEYPSGWDLLLNRLISIKQVENLPDTLVYYGLIPVENATGQSWYYYSSGIQGGGYIGVRVSIGLTDLENYDIDGGVVVSHEVGHNLGRWHSPCGTNDAGAYPYPGAAIGNFGMDVTNLSAFVLYPPEYKDIMSYCDPVWVSDYTYEIWKANQQEAYSSRLSLPEQKTIMIRALVLADGSVELQPVYTLPDGVPDFQRETGEYLIELLDAQNEPFLRQGVDLTRSGDSNSGILSANIAAPEQTPVRLRIWKGNEILAETRLVSETAIQDDSLNPLAIIQTSNGLMLRWGNPDQPAIPAIIRYRSRETGELTALEVDWRGFEYTIHSEFLPAGPIEFEVILAGQPENILRAVWENQQP